MVLKIDVSENISYCMGVERTLHLVEELLRDHPEESYYMLGEIVHNEFVINDLAARGLHVVRSVEEIPLGAKVVIQSHGAPRAVYDRLKEREAHVIDATCPMVKLIHKKIVRLERDGYFPVIVGREGHDEVRGIAGQVKEALIVGTLEEVYPALFVGHDRVGIVIQSTYVRQEAMTIVNKIRSLVSEVKLEDTICRPTTERQDEVRRVAEQYDCIVIVGSRTSANTRHLFKLASGQKACVYLIDDPDQIQNINIPVDSTVFITSGASTPMYLVEKVLAHLYSW